MERGQRPTWQQQVRQALALREFELGEICGGLGNGHGYEADLLDPGMGFVDDYRDLQCHSHEVQSRAVLDFIRSGETGSSLQIAADHAAALAQGTW